MEKSSALTQKLTGKLRVKYSNKRLNIETLKKTKKQQELIKRPKPLVVIQFC